MIEAGGIRRFGSLEPKPASSSTEYTIHDRAEIARGFRGGGT